MDQQQLNHRDMTTCASKGQRRVVIVGGGLVNVSTLHDEELNRAQVARSACFHERRAPTFTLVLLWRQEIISKLQTLLKRFGGLFNIHQHMGLQICKNKNNKLMHFRYSLFLIFQEEFISQSYQVGPSLQQKVSNISVPILASIGQSSVPR